MQMRMHLHTQIKMPNKSCIVTEVVLEDKLADFWPDYLCLYDVRSSDFKKRELRDKALQELAGKLGTTCKLNFNLVVGKLFTKHVLVSTS